MNTLQWLKADPSWFPPSFCALEDPAGLLALGGDLSCERLLNAYRRGIFPWYEKDQPILWWSPNPRMVIVPSELHRSRSLNKHLRSCDWDVTLDQSFSEIISHCAGPRKDQTGTWITSEMDSAYQQLHALGYAHSVEVWNQSGSLVGGLYGVLLGKVFFGESMFSHEANGSKVAISSLCRWLDQQGIALLDCQVESEHLTRLGATNISRDRFEQQLSTYCSESNECDIQLLMSNLKSLSPIQLDL